MKAISFPPVKRAEFSKTEKVCFFGRSLRGPSGVFLGGHPLTTLRSHCWTREGHRWDHRICPHTCVSRPTTTPILLHPQLETPPQTIPAAPKRRKSPTVQIPDVPAALLGFWGKPAPPSPLSCATAALQS